MTTNHEFYGRPDRESATQIILKNQIKENRLAGSKDIPADKQGLKMTSVLTGEKYKNCMENFNCLKISFFC